MATVRTDAERRKCGSACYRTVVCSVMLKPCGVVRLRCGAVRCGAVGSCSWGRTIVTSNAMRQAMQCDTTRHDTTRHDTTHDTIFPHTRASLLCPGGSAVVNAQVLPGTGPRHRGWSLAPHQGLSLPCPVFPVSFSDTAPITQSQPAHLRNSSPAWSNMALRLVPWHDGGGG
jgi:hypothetical protein